MIEWERVPGQRNPLGGNYHRLAVSFEDKKTIPTGECSETVYIARVGDLQFRPYASGRMGYVKGRAQLIKQNRRWGIRNERKIVIPVFGMPPVFRSVKTPYDETTKIFEIDTRGLNGNLSSFISDGKTRGFEKYGYRRHLKRVSENCGVQIEPELFGLFDEIDDEIMNRFVRICNRRRKSPRRRLRTA
jgi:hypothetical protein